MEHSNAHPKREDEGDANPSTPETETTESDMDGDANDEPLDIRDEYMDKLPSEVEEEIENKNG